MPLVTRARKAKEPETKPVSTPTARAPAVEPAAVGSRADDMRDKALLYASSQAFAAAMKDVA